MSTTCGKILEIIDESAPFDYAENWDNVGLLVGDPRKEIQRIFLTLDITDESLNEAIEKNADIIVSHHPLIFSPLKNLRWDNKKGELIKKILRNELCVIAAHTNLDVSSVGINTFLAQRLNLKNTVPLLATNFEKFFKLIVYVPKNYLEEVKAALFETGAGVQGNYENCSFQSEGIGQFRPLKDAKPHIGSRFQLEKVEETKLEILLRQSIVKQTIDRLKEVHPYEEVAYDLFEIADQKFPIGIGIIGDLNNRMEFDDLALKVKSCFNLKHLRIAGNRDLLVDKIAVCSGSGADLGVIAKKAGAQVLITGDMKYHDAQTAYEEDIVIVDVGHFNSEVCAKQVLEEILSKGLENESGIEIIKSERERDFIRYI
ncbi:Nif3-like dinuclear metal center hexameric protein [Alkalibacter mobilis]|uniref:Nif3-like dinuclear metal center hexameric protein n=1 Tax=Alkalibacter mobilis TaxID=2787712 RepID=UPI0018A0E92C|nr:Nif3-like dinuclear metal center hexameric protein [Alkalibacter mobilis]MBF7097712.1 Nif3-like dinuclear metal center hexameric protein [Alkalibacter mobilis]